jgi:hypothetical protein
MSEPVAKHLPDWMAQAVGEDQRRGRELIDAANKAAARGSVPPGSHKICDSAAQLAHDANRAAYSQMALAAAQSLSRARPFFKRLTIRGDGCERSICISDVRTTQSISAYLESDFEVFGWTSPAAPLAAEPIGASVDGQYAQPFIGTVVGRAHYRDRLLPTPSDASLESGAIFGRIARSDDERIPDGHPHAREPAARIRNATSVPPPANEARGHPEPAPHYQAPEQPLPRSLGTLNIAATADQRQWLSFHHDLRRSLLIEGPPGSGKTSVALMRVPCLIDRQWDDLDLKPGRDEPFYSEDKTVVVIPRATLKHALSRLGATVEVPDVRLSTADALAIEVLRRSPFGAPKLRENSEAETDLMRHRRLSTLLRCLLGMRAVAVAEGLSWNPAAQVCSRARVKELENRLLDWAIPLHRGGRTRTFSSIGCTWFADGRKQPAKLVYADRCLLERVCREIFDREGLILSALEATPDPKTLADINLAGIEPLIERWRRAHPADLTAVSQGEWQSLAAIACDLWSRDAREVVPSFLRALPSPTHIVVDEVQDFSDEALGFLQSFLADNGVITAAGDRLQAQRASGSSGMWGGLSVAEFDHVSLEVNYRQSAEVGGFVSRIHRRLFGSEPNWAVGPRRSGAPVRVSASSTTSVEQLARLVSAEVKDFQRWNPHCTIAVIHVGGADFSLKLSELLRALGLRSHTLDSADAKWSDELLLVSTAESCKGLEFDATVVVDLANSGRIDVDLWDSAKKELFVALSRACDRMTVIAGSGASGRLLKTCLE